MTRPYAISFGDEKSMYPPADSLNAAGYARGPCRWRGPNPNGEGPNGEGPNIAEAIR
jgi:hypothetical protein